MADTIAGSLPDTSQSDDTIVFYSCNAEEVHSALLKEGTYHWVKTDTQIPLKTSLQAEAQIYHYQMYRNKRDMKGVYGNTAARWNQYNPALMALLTHTKKKITPRARGRLTKHIYDWMAHAHNLAKSSKLEDREQDSKCILCGLKDTQAHADTSCQHPELQDLRASHKQIIDQLFQTLSHTPLPPAQRWIRPLMAFAEKYI